jgi:hypothetical protein
MTQIAVDHVVHDCPSLDLDAMLSVMRARIGFEVRAYEGSVPVDSHAFGERRELIGFKGAKWTVESETTTRATDAEGAAFAVRLTARPTNRSVDQVSLILKLQLDGWRRQNYVMFPGAVYAGNRFEVADSWVADHLLQTRRSIGDVPMISPVPRLCRGTGVSCVQLLAGDMSTPAMLIHDGQHVLILLTDQGTSAGDYGFRLSESEDRKSATLELSSPGVRQGVRYDNLPSPDRGAKLTMGEALHLHAHVYVFPASTIDAAIEAFFACRSDLAKAVRREDVPFSKVRSIQLDKYNRQNWVEAEGYYSVGMREVPSQDWQTSWVGGLNTAYGLLRIGDETTRSRAKQTISFACKRAPLPSGFLRTTYSRGVWHDRQTLLRYQGDALCFICKSIDLLRSVGEPIPGEWLGAAHGIANAFCRLWDQHGQFGHYVSHAGELLVPDTASASLAPGALAIAARVLNDRRYRDIAIEAGVHFDEQYLRHGLTNGGPGDALQCPDSESAFALLESYIALMEETADRAWIDRAARAAQLCATWCVNYDFRFPPASTFAKLDMRTAGTVYANVQNKHSAPGICTLSGLSLLKLFRVTSDVRYLDLVSQIAHAIPQYMSRLDRPITDRRPNQRWAVMEPGWINERVNMSDWECRGNPDHDIQVGEIFGGSTWSEAAMILTCAELPGVYLQPDTRILRSLDHVEASLDGNTLRFANPTSFDAEVAVWIESSSEARRLDGRAEPYPKVRVAAGETITLPVDTRPVHRDAVDAAAGV